ncbi:hypothetical protein K32_41510 [Kaistia sp. 32K]|uniref:hypothetical protein n=1 Tax=Kaistia sp. 32K TaxID=2795690 RepID=UPI001914FDD0|nr:hypothetical protein [Kaistia sp. 32K]BCP55534.1 hypothetical protein K32_41510 [Kaistia sp. 32K]
MRLLDRILDPFRGRAITIPPYDGAFKPNTALEEAPVRLEHEAPDNLLFWAGRPVFSAGNFVHALEGGGTRELARFDAPVSALAALTDETLVVALESGRIVLHDGASEGRTFDRLGSEPLVSPTAIAVLDATTIVVAQGSARHAPSDWVVDLMEKRATGSVWKLDISSGAGTLLARDLAWPSGVHAGPDGTIHVSEAFAHRLVRLEAGKRPAPVLTRIPGYAGRLSAARDGGFWLAVFAPRNRLIEFVLQEDRFRRDMLETVERQNWIAPALSSGSSFLEPLQCGAVRTMGVHKPWAPSRSYGLAVRLDAGLQPVQSFHSRSDGTRHGLTSVLETGDSVLATVTGAGLIVDLGKGEPQ